ncbi:hypothetical protein F5887DRAFT_303621 [Amanita rubescens]|nr:hypothetical protein F5887DRAFT_303621 [Amanita rubescens]
MNTSSLSNRHINLYLDTALSPGNGLLPFGALCILPSISHFTALLKATGLAETGALGDWLLITCPRILHGSLAALTDIWLGHLTRRILGERCVPTALLLSFTCLFHALALSRSLSNSLETSLTTIAFAYYPWDATARSSPNVYFKRSDLPIMFLFIALACMVRPLNAIIWVYLISKLIWILLPHPRLVKVVVQDALIVGDPHFS